MNNIDLLDQAINLYSNGNQAKFAEFTYIKESTIKTWRSRGAVPDDKVLLLNTLIENHKLEEDMKKVKAFFELGRGIN